MNRLLVFAGPLEGQGRGGHRAALLVAISSQRRKFAKARRQQAPEAACEGGQRERKHFAW